ncbi:MAG: TonB-dependent receptor [Campylobacterota bacterium]|nr:TonB-dependent receptor [Campylobacterota bacterium]
MQKLLLSALATTLLVANETQTYQLGTISISASPINQRTTFDSPNQVDVIDDTQKTLKSTASLGEVLEDFSGVNNIATGPQAGKPVVRGMGNERVKVLSNGSPTDSQTYGIRHVVNVDPFVAERIEVVRGAQGVLYGSDALGGIVNILSPEILYAEDGESKAQGKIAAEYHTNNKERMGGAKIQAAHGKLGANVTVVKRKADNFNTPDADTYKKGEPAGDKPLFSGELPYTNFDNSSALVAIGYTDDWGDIAIQHTYWQSYQNYLGHTKDLKPITSAGQKLTNNETQLKSEIFVDEWTLKPTLSHTFNQREAATGTPYEEMDSANGTPKYLDIEVKRLDWRFAVEHPKVGDFEGEIGFEGFDKEQELLQGKLAPSADENGKSIYIFEEADYNKWLVQAGLRYDHKSVYAPLDGNNKYFVDNGIFDATNNSKDFSGFSGSLGATYRLTPNWNIAGNIAKGFRAPSIFELYAGGMHGGVMAFQLGNPELNEESSLGADISLRYMSRETKATLSVYHTRIKDYIYLANTGNIRVVNGMELPEMQNRQTDATMEGIEFSMDSYVTSSTNIEGAFELIKGRDTNNDSKLTMMPSNNLRLAIHQNVGSLWVLDNSTFSLNMKYVDSSKVAGSHEPFSQYNNTPFGTADTDAYNLWGIAYAADIKMGKENAKLGVKVTNLFDTEYRDFLDTYKGYALGMGRDISVTLIMPFSL